jgi:hypothetical protein
MPVEIKRPKGQDGQDLQAPRLGRWPSEDVVYHDAETKKRSEIKQQREAKQAGREGRDGLYQNA